MNRTNPYRTIFNHSTGPVERIPQAANIINGFIGKARGAGTLESCTNNVFDNYYYTNHDDNHYQAKNYDFSARKPYW